MGIKGLHNLLKSFADYSDILEFPELKDIEHSVIRSHLSAFTNNTIAIDFNNILYRFLRRCKTSNVYILEFINLIDKLQSYNINIIFVFDGLTQLEKQHAIANRRYKRAKLDTRITDVLNNTVLSDIDRTTQIEMLNKNNIMITPAHIEECKKLFDVLGIPYIYCEHIEADKIFKYLLDNKYADACYSNDTDLIVYGCHTVLFDFDYIDNTFNCVYYNKLLKFLKLTPIQFIHSCILSGTDYNDHLKYSKLTNNIMLIKKYYTIENIIACLDDINSNGIDIPDGKPHYVIPERFNWETTYKIYTETLSPQTQDNIKIQLNIHLLHTTNIYENKDTYQEIIEHYLHNNIYIRGKLEKEEARANKYIVKYSDIVKLKFNIDINIHIYYPQYRLLYGYST